MFAQKGCGIKKNHPQNKKLLNGFLEKKNIFAFRFSKDETTIQKLMCKITQA